MLKICRKPNVSYLHPFAFLGWLGLVRQVSVRCLFYGRGEQPKGLMRDRQSSTIVFLNCILLGIFTRFLVVCLVYSRVK